MKKVIIVGGGITGLATAYFLNQRGVEVLVLEKGDTCGGVIKTYREQGFTFEFAAHTLTYFDASIENLLEELKIKGELISPSPKAQKKFICKNGKLIPLSPHPIHFLKTSLLSTAAKLRILAELFTRPTSRRGPAMKERPDESIYAFFERHFGRELTQTVIDPLVSGIYAGDIYKLSAVACFPKLKELENKHGSLIRALLRNPPKKSTAYSFKEGMETLVQTLSQKLENLTVRKCPVTRIEKKEDSFIIHAKRETSIEQWAATHIVLATPAFETAKLLRSISPDIADELTKIPYAPMVVVGIAYDIDLSENDKGFGFLIPRKENFRLLGGIFNSVIFPNRAPSQKTSLTLYLGGQNDPKITSLSEEEIATIAQSELKQLLGIEKPPTYCKIHRIPQAIPQYELGHQERIGKILSSLDSIPGVSLLGNYLDGVAVTDRIRQAKKFAKNFSSRI